MASLVCYDSWIECLKEVYVNGIITSINRDRIFTKFYLVHEGAFINCMRK